MAAAEKAIQSVSSSERNAAQTAIQYVLENPAVTSAVVGIRTMEQLKEAVGAIDKPLTEEEIKVLKESVPVNFYEQHR